MRKLLGFVAVVAISLLTYAVFSNAKSWAMQEAEFQATIRIIAESNIEFAKEHDIETQDVVNRAEADVAKYPHIRYLKNYLSCIEEELANGQK